MTKSLMRQIALGFWRGGADCQAAGRRGSKGRACALVGADDLARGGLRDQVQGSGQELAEAIFADAVLAERERRHAHWFGRPDFFCLPIELHANRTA